MTEGCTYFSSTEWDDRRWVVAKEWNLDSLLDSPLVGDADAEIERALVRRLDVPDADALADYTVGDIWPTDDPPAGITRDDVLSAWDAREETPDPPAECPHEPTDGDSFWNRWLTLVFPEGIPWDEQDPHLTDTLTQPDELSGALDWALDGYDLPREHGRFTNEPLPWQNQQKWQRYGDSFDQFFDAYMETDPDAQVPKWDAYKSYKQFATENRMEVISDSKFTKEMKQQNGVSYGQRRVDDRRTYCYIRVSLTDDAPNRPKKATTKTMGAAGARRQFERLLNSSITGNNPCSQDSKDFLSKFILNHPRSIPDIQIMLIG